MEDFKTLIKPRSLSECRAAYVFNMFCAFTLASEGQQTDITPPGVAQLMYSRLVHWFDTVGRQFFPEINGYDSAALALYMNTGISESGDLIRLFSSDLVGQLVRPGETPVFVVPSVEENAQAPVTGGAYDVPASDMPAVRPDPVPYDIPGVTDTVPVPAPASDAPAGAVPADDADNTEDDGIEDMPEEKPRAKRRSYSGVKRVRGQHIGIKVPEPIKERCIYYMLSKGCKDLFVLHGDPADPNDVVLYYRPEPGKTLDDYRGAASCWESPYMMALRHDYKERTGCDILKVRKVRLDRWLSVYKKKYELARRVAKRQRKLAAKAAEKAARKTK